MAIAMDVPYIWEIYIYNIHDLYMSISFIYTIKKHIYK